MCHPRCAPNALWDSRRADRNHASHSVRLGPFSLQLPMAARMRHSGARFGGCQLSIHEENLFYKIGALTFHVEQQQDIVDLIGDREHNSLALSPEQLK